MLVRNEPWVCSLPNLERIGRFCDILCIGPQSIHVSRRHVYVSAPSRLAERCAVCCGRRCLRPPARPPRIDGGMDMQERPQSVVEEVGNSVSHGLGFLLAVAAAPILIASAAKRGHAADVVGSAVFAATMIVLYLSSAVYHAMPCNRGKRILAKIDHGAIYLFIAGTYTPFALGVLNGAWGWTLFGLIWGLAAVGLTLKSLDRLSHPVFSTGLYLAMGWLVVIAAVPLVERVSMAGVSLLVAGGVAYTAGVAFYLTDTRLKFGHLVWHLFVMVGTACHFFAVLWYSA
jgi:hemolysin III